MSEPPAKRTAKKAAAKRLTALRRPESNGALLNNPALSGVKETVNRSYLGGGQGAIPGPPTSDDAPSPDPTTTPDRPQAAASAPETAPTTGSARPAEPVALHPSSADHAPHAQETGLPEHRGVRSTTPASEFEPASDIPDQPTGAQSTTSDSRRVVAEEPEVAAEANGVGSKSDRTQLTPTGNHSETTEVSDGDDVTIDADDDKEADAKKRSTTPRARRRQTAQQILEKSYTESVIDLRLRKKDWAAHPFRFTPAQITQVNKRAAEDSAATGLPLTSAQYVNAAMTMHLPATLEEQLDLAESFLRDMGARRIPEGQQSSYRVSPEVLAIVRPLSNHLKAAGKARTGYHIYSAVLARFLKDLASEGPLTFES